MPRLTALMLLLLLALVPRLSAQGAIVEMGNSEPITANSPIVVSLTAAGSVDLRYGGAAGEMITVTARSLEAAGALDTTLEVLNSDGRRLAFNDDHASAGAELASYDSLISDLRLTSDDDVIVRVSSFNGSGSGRVEVLVSSANAAAPTEEPAATAERGTNVITGVVPDNDSFEQTVTAQAGDIVTITVRATDNVLDPKVALIDPNGSVAAQNDDHESDDLSLGRFDSRIRDFALTESGTYTIRITGYSGTGGAFELTIEQGVGIIPPTATPGPTDAPHSPVSETIAGSIESNGVFTHEFDAQAGDVYTITVRAAPQSELDPRILLYDSAGSFVFGNDDHGTSDPTLAFRDGRIFNLIVQAADTYTLAVDGYEGSAGDFVVTLERVATNAPLGDGDDELFTGTISANSTYTQTFDAQAGDYVTITVQSQTQDFDPRVQLLSPDGVILADNDDHGTGAVELDVYDSRISNFIIPKTDIYTIEVQGYRASAGAFKLTITTLR
jgi:hypothetical protein